MKKSVLVLSILLVQAFSSQFITIGTGGVTGTYYPTGGLICKLVNEIKEKSGIRCSVEATGGSVYNVNSIRRKELDFGIVQSDVVHYAAQGKGKFEGKKVSKLRSVMAIYPEMFTLVTRKDAKIKSIMDIKGKRINLGNPGSGNETTALGLFKALNIKKIDLAYAGALKASQTPDALKDDKIDGYFYMVGHPNTNIKDASNLIDVKIIPLEGKEINSYIKTKPFYTKTIIPGGLYKGNENNIKTFGVKAVLVTSSDVDENTVYTIVKQIFENFEDFKKLRPFYSDISKKSLLEGLSTNLHPGAEKYYKEIGLIN